MKNTTEREREKKHIHKRKKKKSLLFSLRNKTLKIKNNNHIQALNLIEFVD